MKNLLLLLFSLCCLALHGHKPEVKVVNPRLNFSMGHDSRMAYDLQVSFNLEPINGTLTLGVDQTYNVTSEILDLDTLIMMDGAKIVLTQQHTTIVVGHAIIGTGCSIYGEGAPGKPGRDGRDGGSYGVETPGGTKIVYDGEEGQPGEQGGPAKELDIYLESIRYEAPLNILLQGGTGGNGGDGGNGAPKKARCGSVTVGTNGGDGAGGGEPGSGGFPRIMLGIGASKQSLEATSRLGGSGMSGRAGKAGPVKKITCASGVAMITPGWPGTSGDGFFESNDIKSTGQGVTLYFPYPPPKPSAMVAELPVEVKADATLGTVEDRLRAALQSCGYEDLRYYKVPEGYAVVTGMERFTDKGVPLTEARWSGKASFVSEFSLAGYLKSLFTARKGYFRLIVFMVTADDLLTKDERISRAEALSWFKSGWSRLPGELAETPFTTEHYVSALIYEFSVTENADGPVFSEPSSLSAEAHLRGAALWNRLVSDR